MTDGWRNILGTIAEANEEGIDLKAQVCGRPVGVLFGLELTNNPFSAHPSYQAIDHLPLDKKLEKLRDLSFKEQLLKEVPELETNPFMRQVHKRYQDLYVLDDEPPIRTLLGNSHRR